MSNNDIEEIIENYIENKDDKNKLLEDFFEKYYDIISNHDDIFHALIKDMKLYTEGEGFSDCRNFVEIINKKYGDKNIYYLEKELKKLDIEKEYIYVKNIKPNIYQLKFDKDLWRSWNIYLKYENNMFEVIYGITWKANGLGQNKYYFYKNKNENIDIIEKICEIISKEEILQLKENLEISKRLLVVYDKNDYDKVSIKNVHKLIDRLTIS